jgi:hypothetical protein
MFEKIKTMPLSVKLAILFLISVYITMCVLVPPVGLALGITAPSLWSIFRIMTYFVDGE